MSLRLAKVVFALAVLALIPVRIARGGDWPMWRHDAARTAVCPDALPADLHLQWVRQLPAPAAAWPPDQHKLQFDLSYEPVAAGGLVFIGSMMSDWIAAFDIATGDERWRYYTDGPVRFAPVVDADRLLCVSDDGHLYCLEAATGTLRWKFRGGPSDRRVLGNDRLISTWPARGAPVVDGGRVYFSAGIWPFMGTFIHCLDAATGAVVWTNSGSGSQYLTQQHHSPAFAGAAPQGYFALSPETLLVSGGRTVPAAYDRGTGAFRYYRVSESTLDKSAGGYDVATRGEWHFNGQRIYRLADGEPLLHVPSTVLTDEMVIGVGGKGEIVAHALPPVEEEYVDRKGEKKKRLMIKKLWDLPLGSPVEKVFLKAGPRLYVSAKDSQIAAIELPAADQPSVASWQSHVEGRPWSMIAAQDRLLVMTEQGTLYCFGGDQVEPRVIAASKDPVAIPPVSAAASLVRETGISAGYCLVLGLADGSLVEGFARATPMHIIGIDPDAERVQAMRRRFDAAGAYGSRIAIFTGDVRSAELPPYLASLIVSEDWSRSGLWGAGILSAESADADPPVQTLFNTLRPYGGTACLAAPAPNSEDLADLVKRAGLANAVVQPMPDNLVMLRREGSLPGAGEWTHQYGDSANTVVSQDELARTPLGLLWFGGPSNAGILPRHGHGPAPQIAGGRFVIEGPEMLRAVDVYTGRLLWERALPGIGKYYDNTGHEPGAGAIGSNYVTLRDGIYVAYGTRGLRLDPTTGNTVKEFTLPAMTNGEGPPEWGYIGVCDDVLLAGARPLMFWAPDFEPQDFRKIEQKDVERLTAVMKQWNTFALEPQREGEGAPDFISRNLNRAIAHPDLLESIPQAVRAAAQADAKKGAKIEVLRKQIADHLAHRGDIQASDPALEELNRGLLEQYYGLPSKSRPPPGQDTLDRSASSRLVALDRNTGKMLWKIDARHALRHNAIAAGGGMVFVLDRLPDPELDRLRRRGQEPPTGARLIALDLHTGSEIWSTEKEIFGTWLAYSQEHDIVVQAGSRNRDRLFDEVGQGLGAYRGTDGTPLWMSDKEYGGPVLLHHDTIITQGAAFELLTGREKMRSHPITGRPVPWKFSRNYGCNTAIGSEHLLTFRSAAAGYYDLACDGGTGNFGGFRSGCTSNLIAADGLLNAPDYTRTCTCSYQNQSSLAMVHDPDVETWTFSADKPDDAPVMRLGINLGAPGDRLADNGTLWLDYPSEGGSSPDVPIRTRPEQPAWFREHPTAIAEGELKWVLASGVDGLEEMTIRVGPDGSAARPYTVRLFFAEREGAKPGERVLSVRLQGREVLKGFDIVAEARRPRVGVVREFKGIEASDNLVIGLEASAGVSRLCGIEIISENAANPARSP